MPEVIDTPTLKRSWPVVSECLVIHNKHDYDAAIVRLNELLDEVGENTKHPLYEFLDVLGVMIEHYEGEHYPFEEVKGLDVLRYLMQEHGLHQSDLKEIGSQGIVSEVLNGKRQLNVNQIRRLSQRFKVSPSVFF